MKFTLLFYTNGWASGPVIELSHIPSPGNVVWTAGKRQGEDGDMYYVDNVMYPERGVEQEDTVYLYVRPYTGYANYAPLTESDRIVDKLREVKNLMESLMRILDRSGTVNATLAEDVSVVRKAAEDLSIIAGEKDLVAGPAADQLIKLADAIEDGQQTQIVKMDDILVLLEELKERL